jgi:exopolysaccharide production protein ExoQ
VAVKALTRADQRLWRLLIWVIGLAIPTLSSLKPRNFDIADVIDQPDSLSHLAIKGFFIFFLFLAMLTFTRRSGKDRKQGEARVFFLITVFAAAMPTLSSLISGGTFQLTIIGTIGIYSATYFLPAPPLEWWAREVRIMLLIVFIYGSLAVAVLYPDWAWNKDYGIESTVSVFSWRLYGTTNHSNSLAPIAVISWLLGRFPGCRLKGELLHGVAVLTVLFFTQSKTIWAIAFILLGAYILIRIASLGGFRKYMTFFAAGTGVYALAVYLIKYSSLASRIKDMQYNQQVLSLTGRLVLWAYAFQVWRQNPWFGKGLDAWFSKAALENNTGIFGWAVPNAHNELLQVLSESGLIGLCVMAIWFLYIIKITRRVPSELRIPMWWLSAFFILPGFTEVVLIYGIGSGPSILTWIFFTTILIMAKSRNEQKECINI